MDYNDFSAGNDSFSANSGYYGSGRWNDFSVEDEKTAKGRFSRFFLATSLYLISSTVAMIAIEFLILLLAGERAKEIIDNNLILWGCNILAMYIIALPIFYLITRKMKSAFRSKSALSFKDFLVYFFIGEALMFAGNFIGTVIVTFIEAFMGRSIANDTSELIENSPVWLICAVVVVIGPIIEEFIFRKVLMDKLGMYGDRIAILVSAVAFGLFHGNLHQLFYASLLGALLAYVYSRTSNIWYPIVLHMLINFFGSVIPIFIINHVDRYLEILEIIAAGGEYNAEEFAQVSLIAVSYSMFQYAMLFIGLFLLYKMRKSIFVSDRCEICIPRERRANVILLNAGAILFILISLVTIILDIVIPS